MLAAVVNDAAVFGLARFARFQQQLAMEQLREADDGVERRPQLVTDGGDERGLGAAGALGFVARLLHRERVPFAGRDVAHHDDDAVGGRERRAPQLQPFRRRGFHQRRDLDLQRNGGAEFEALGDGLVAARGVGGTHRRRQPVPHQPRRRYAEEGVSCRRCERDFAVGVVARDDIAGVVGDQAIGRAALFKREPRQAMASVQRDDGRHRVEGDRRQGGDAERPGEHDGRRQRDGGQQTAEDVESGDLVAVTDGMNPAGKEVSNPLARPTTHMKSHALLAANAAPPLLNCRGAL